LAFFVLILEIITLLDALGFDALGFDATMIRVMAI